MATMHYSIPRFYGARYGTADNLVPLGYAAMACNVDTFDGALQAIVGVYPYPDDVAAGLSDISIRPDLMWEPRSGGTLCISGQNVVAVEAFSHDWDERTRGSVAFTPASADDKALLAGCSSIVPAEISGERVIIGLSDVYSSGRGPFVLGYENGFYIRRFGTGQFLTSDMITEVFLNSDNRITGVKINRVMTADEVARCVYAGVYVMEDEDEELDFTAVYVREVRLFTSTSTIVFKDTLPGTAISVGDYVKVRGGLSDRPVTQMAFHFGRLFAGGDAEYPNRLYWSCLPGDGRTIEDWSADDASPDTGGGYVQVGGPGTISALVEFHSQLLIWKGDELWRLYGATPSQYTLELVYAGVGDKLSTDPILPEVMRKRIALVHGVPYMILDDGLFYYNGSSLERVDLDHSLQALLQLTGLSVYDYELDLSRELSQVQGLAFWRGGLYFSLPASSRWRLFLPDAALNRSSFLVKYDLESGALTTYDCGNYIAASRRGLLIRNNRIGSGTKRAFVLLERLDMTKAYEAGILRGRLELDDEHPADPPVETPWVEAYHFFPGAETQTRRPINAVWESSDLSFGDISAPKKLSRVGLDVTGPIRVIVTAPEGTLHDKTLPAADDERRMLWLQIDMPYESTFRIRFESVEGHPFRVNNGVDFYVETRTRS